MAVRSFGAVTKVAIVAMGEDHCFPYHGWAAALLAAHADGSASVVGPVVRNGNPAAMVSIADFLGTKDERSVHADSACSQPGHGTNCTLTDSRIPKKLTGGRLPQPLEAASRCESITIAIGPGRSLDMDSACAHKKASSPSRTLGQGSSLGG